MFSCLYINRAVKHQHINTIFAASSHPISPRTNNSYLQLQYIYCARSRAMSNRQKSQTSSSSSSPSTSKLSRQTSHRTPTSNRQSQAASSSTVQEDMPTKFNRVRVEDLLNTESAGASSSRHRSSHKSSSSSRPKSSRSSSDSPPSHLNIPCEFSGCKRTFHSLESLRAHQKRSHPAPTAFVCDICKSSFSTPPNLNKHVRVK